MEKVNKVFDLIMVTTHQSEFNIYKLFESIDNNIREIELLLLVVSQDCKVNYIPRNSLFSIRLINEMKMSLSKARNIALDFLIANNISSSYIMFPDDDSSFDKFFFKNYLVTTDSIHNFITPIYNENSKDLYLGKNQENGRFIGTRDINLIGSPNQLILYDKYKNQIYFDENLGVGAKYGSSEDLDIFMRLNLIGAKYIYTDKIYSYHPKKTDLYNKKKLKDILIRFKSYSSGFAIIIFRYKLYRLIFSYLFRPFAAAIYYTIRLNLKLSLAYFLQFIIRIQYLVIFSIYKR